jgi:N6-adenosine-specific RNA methylase IME4
MNAFSEVFQDLPQRHFGALMVDPPWRYKSWTPLTVDNAADRRDAEKHYPVMGLNAIKALPVKELALKDAHLFLWTTSPHLKQAFEVLDAWGFRYSSVGFVWVKLKKNFDADQLRFAPIIDADLNFGMGHTTRKNAEICLLARRGSPHRLAKNVREIILAPIREHSRKPDEAFERIERYCSGPYLDLFSRERRPNWTGWGNEADKYGRKAA